MKKTTKTYPVNLLLQGQSCLIVGGGKVATRKLQGLLKVDCRITVVAPKASQAIANLAAQQTISWHRRNYTESDLDGIYLAVIASDDRELNRTILNSCRVKGILCGVADRNWQDGHFITPASLEKDGIQVAVSTHGKSCRRTRLIKDNLAKHIDLVDRAELMIIGTDHNLLNLTEREPYHLIGENYDRAGNLLSHIWGIHEYMLLNTCNRIELAAIVSPNADMEQLIKQIMGLSNLNSDCYYVKYGSAAFAHLSSVLAGLKSQTPGEKHIVAQLKAALEKAKDKGWSSGMMQEWLDSSLHISKHIRQATEPHLKQTEIEDLTMAYINSECPQLNRQKALVIGTGIVGESIVNKLSPQVAELYWCYYRNKPSSPNAADHIISMAELPAHLAKVDLIVCATSAAVPVLHQDHAPFFAGNQPKLMIDLAIPRNIAPELENELPGTRIVDLDDLKHWFRREAADMSKIIEISEAIITDHHDMYEKILFHFQGDNR